MADIIYETPEVAAVYENGALVLPRPSFLRFALPMIMPELALRVGILSGDIAGDQGMPKVPVGFIQYSAPIVEHSGHRCPGIAASAPTATVQVTPVSASAATYVPVIYMQPLSR